MTCGELIEWIQIFKTRTGKAPIALYIGYSTLMELKRDVYTNRYMSPPHRHGDREKFNGIPIYEVNKHTHIGAGI